MKMLPEPMYTVLNKLYNIIIILKETARLRRASTAMAQSNDSPTTAFLYKYRMAGNFGGKIFWRIAENMSFGGIYFGG